jgi:RHH-type proline utilization regulon transcriptional repressor/proline dehydrogenase/delta 1-pyrroline-5-carboxylate dehydrogenase
VGPVIDDAARQRIHEYVGMGRSEGKLLVQAKLPAACERGFFVAPTIFDGVKPGARIAQEEIFGPVLAILRARDFDDAIDIANGTRYALTGGLFSRSPAHIEQARRDFAVGNLYVNRRITGSQVDAQPFGGFKLSGTGVKAGSPDYLLHFMDARCLTENTLRSGLVPDEEHTEVS